MAQLWGGRFTKETDQLVYNFNASITFDKRFYKQDIKGSLAHVAIACKAGNLNGRRKRTDHRWTEWHFGRCRVRKIRDIR